MKIKIYSILALGLALAACDDVDLGTGIPVVNPELPAAGPDLVTVTQKADIPAVISLEQYNEQGQKIALATASAAEGWPEGYRFGANAEFSTSEDFSNAFTLPVVVEGETFTIEPAALDEAVRKNITKNPVDQTLYVRYNVSAVKGNESIILGGPDKFYCPMKITVLPYAPYAIDATYYYVWSNTPDAWTADNAAAMSFKGDNQYDNPEFSGVFTVTAGDYWMIVSASDLESGNFTGAFTATEADAAKDKGTLTETGGTPGKMALSGPVEFKFNRETLEFSYKQAIANIWMAGSGVNGTSWNAGQFAMVLFTQDYENYAGYASLSGAAQPEFKFSPTNAWSGDFGVGADLEFTTSESGVVSAKGKADGGTNIKVPAEGLYFINLNYVSRDLTITEISTIGLIGGFNGWAESLALTPSDDKLTWTGTVTMNAGDEWKIRANNGWDINLGGTADNLTCFGNPANLVCSEAGTYTVTLHLDNIPYTVTLERQ